MRLRKQWYLINDSVLLQTPPNPLLKLRLASVYLRAALEDKEIYVE